MNADHELVIAHEDEPGARALLEDVVTAEALLEVYLREQGLSRHAVGEVLERRDLLLRSLTRDGRTHWPALRLTCATRPTTSTT